MSAGAPIRHALARKALAAASELASVATILGVHVTDMLAIEQLVACGRLSPTQLGRRLGLSSGASTTLVQRLERTGCVVREPHPEDGRSVLVRLSPGVQERLQEIKAPLPEQIDELTARLTQSERVAITHFVRRVAELAELHAEVVSRRARRQEPGPPVVATPGLWA